MTPPPPYNSLSSLLSTLSAPAPALALSLSLQHQLAGQLRLQRALDDLTHQREVLGGLLARQVHAGEDAIAAEARLGGKGGSRKGKGKELEAEVMEEVFATAYDRATASFDSSLSSNSSAEPLPTSPSWINHPSLPPHTTTTTLQSLQIILKDPMALGAGIATLEGSALSALLSATAPSSSGATAIPSPLYLLLHLLLAARGPTAVLELALGCWEMAIREIVGREESDSSTSEADGEKGSTVDLGLGLGLGEGVGLGLGLGGEKGEGAPSRAGVGGRKQRGQREKELEEFLVGMLGVLEGLGVSLSSPPPASRPGTSPRPAPHIGGGGGPLQLNRTHETILLQLIADSRALRSHSPSPTPHPAPRAPSSPPPKSPSSPTTNSHWSTTLARGATDTFSSLSAYPLAGLSTVSGMLPPLPSSPIPSAFYSPSPNPTPSTPPTRTTEKSEEEENQPPPLPPKPPSAQSSPSSFSTSRFSPSQFLPSPELPPKDKDPLEILLRRAAADLLVAFTPTNEAEAGDEPVTLVQALISHLLSTSFPAPSPSSSLPTPNSHPSPNSSNPCSSGLSAPSATPSPHPSSPASAAHQKILLLALLRWWAFSWLGSKLGRPSGGGCIESAEVWVGVRLSGRVDSGGEGRGGEGEGAGDGGAGRKRSSALLDEIWLPEEEATRLGRGVQKVIYRALVEGCGASSSGATEGGAEKDEMRRAATGFVEGWRSGGRREEQEKKEAGGGGGRGRLTAFDLSVEEYSTLLSSFGPIILPNRTPFPSHQSTPRAGGRNPSSPSPNRQQNSSSSSAHSSCTSTSTSPPQRSMSFKRSSAFGSPTPLTSAPSLGLASGGGDQGSDEAGGEPSLAEKIEELLERLSWIGRDSEGKRGLGEALLFAFEREGRGGVEIRETLPSWEELSDKGEVGAATTPQDRPPPPPPLCANSTTTRTNEWTSPPQSPRQEALRHAMDRPSYPFPSPSPVSSIREDPFLSASLGATFAPLWLAGGMSNLEKTQKDDSPTEPELALLRRGLFSLARSRPITLGADIDLPSLLAAASTRAAREQNYLSQVLYEQTASVLRYYKERGVAVERLVEKVVEPLRVEMRRREEEERMLKRWNRNFEQQRMVLIERAREERGILNDLRLRAWYASIRSSPLGHQLRSRLSELHLPRTPLQRSQAQSALEGWRKELGVYSFTRPEEGDTSFDEALMLLETATAIECQVEMVFKGRIWAREKVLARMVGSQGKEAEQTQEATMRPTFAESLLASGSSILSAPLSLAGLPLPSSPSIPGTTDAQPSTEPLTLLSFGACHPSLLRLHESPTPSSAAIEQFLLRLQLKLAAYLWSDLSSTLISPRNHEGRLCGSDAWFEEFACPLSPLPRPEEKELKTGVKLVPKAYLPTTPKPPDYLIKILERFSQHPSPHAKMHALLELELVLSATMSAPLSAQGRESVDFSPKTTMQPPEGAKGYLSKLTSFLPSRDRPPLTKRMSLPPKPITAVLEDDLRSTFVADLLGATTSADGDRTPSLSDVPHRRSRSTSRPLSLTSSASDIPSLLPTLLDFSSTSTSVSPLSSTIPLSPAPLTTDAFLLTLESLLLHALPSLPHLFQSLQIIASLTPPAILDHHALGKVFWDTAGAALSLKREVVDGEFGVVERGMRALSDGTEEGRELAERLVKIAAREESEVALSLLGSMGLSH